MKEYISATIDNLEAVYNIVQNSIKETYLRYYPTEVVDFFCNLHSKENILKDIEEGLVGILTVDGKSVGTGCYKDNHITRVYVEPEYQGRGYGREAIRLALDFIRTWPCGKAEYCEISYEPENENAAELYHSFGFKENGEMDGDEIVAVLKL